MFTMKQLLCTAFTAGNSNLMLGGTWKRISAGH